MQYYMLWGGVINTKMIMLQWNISLNFLRMTLHTPRGTESHWALWNSQRLSFYQPGLWGWFHFEPQSCGCWWWARAPRWECNYNVLPFLTSCVWVMGCNLNNLSFSYLQRAVLCAHLISQSFFMSARKRRRVLIVRRLVILKPIAPFP